MTAEAEQFAAEDAKKKDLVEARNLAEALVYNTEKALKEAGDKVSAEERKNIEDKIAAVNDAKKSEDATTIKKATEELSAAAQKIGEALYKTPSPAKPESEQKAEEPKETKAEEKK